MVSSASLEESAGGARRGKAALILRGIACAAGKQQRKGKRRRGYSFLHAPAPIKQNLYSDFIIFVTEFTTRKDTFGTYKKLREHSRSFLGFM